MAASAKATFGKLPSQGYIYLAAVAISCTARLLTELTASGNGGKTSKVFEERDDCAVCEEETVEHILTNCKRNIEDGVA